MTDSPSARSPLPTRSLADLVVPRRPAGVPYVQGDDYDARALLTANGYAIATPDLLTALDVDIAVLQAAAARLLGARGEQATIPAITRLAHDQSVEDTTRVQAAFALARMQADGARDLLLQFVLLSPDASPAPLHAASALAQLGDPSGFPLVRAALDSTNPVTAMIACKQLCHFVPLDAQPLRDGSRVDVRGALERVGARLELSIAGEARAQLAALWQEPVQ